MPVIYVHTSQQALASKLFPECMAGGTSPGWSGHCQTNFLLNCPTPFSIMYMLN